MFDLTEHTCINVQFLLFALQYLRAGLTVPIYFEHEEKMASHNYEKAAKLESKSKKIVAIITSAQASLLLLECLAVLFACLYTTDDTYNEDWWYNTTYLGSAAVMLVAEAVTAWAGILIRKWKKSELSPHGYQWNFKDEGFFLLFWVAQSF